MAVKSRTENNKLILELDNGDIIKFEDVMRKWSFKDHQSLIRFVISMLILNEGKSFSFLIDGHQQEIVPNSNYLLEDKKDGRNK